MGNTLRELESLNGWEEYAYKWWYIFCCWTLHIWLDIHASDTVGILLEGREDIFQETMVKQGILDENNTVLYYEVTGSAGFRWTQQCQ